MAEHPHFGNLSGMTTQEWSASFNKTSIKKSIVLSTEERTGSEWLCELMISTGVLGRPSEYLNTAWFKRFLLDYPDSISQAISIAHSVGTTDNGVFSMKLHTQHLDRLGAVVPLIRAFPHPTFVWLSRKDKLAQAISLVRARQTMRYHNNWIAEGTETFDARLITDILHEVVFLSARWESYFARNAITPLRIFYEDLESNPLDIVNKLAENVSVSLDPCVSLHTKITRQRDEISVKWRDMYLEKERNLDFLDDLTPRSVP